MDKCHAVKERVEIGVCAIAILQMCVPVTLRGVSRWIV